MSLESDFEAVLTFDGTQAMYTGNYMSSGWTDAIDSYSNGITDELGNAVGVRNKNDLLTALKVAFNQFDEATTLAQIDTAISAYWNGVTFAFSNVPPDGQPGSGVSNIVTDTGGGFNPTRVPVINSVSDGAQRLSDAIEARTQTVKTTIHYFTPSGSPTSKVLSIH